MNIANGTTYEVTYDRKPEGWDHCTHSDIGGVTVVFLNYNKTSMIERSLKATLDQDYPLLDMLFMDDASCDGSGDMMEELVRQYKGRHRVRVVRNKKKRGIPGQWNLAAALADGEWLGMFCADDISHPDRVSQVASVIVQHPTLKGLCTSGYEINPKTGTRSAILPDWPSELVTGASSFDELKRIDTPVIGATAFWHKSVFSSPLPNVRLDDIMLRWILQMQNRTSVEPIWMWCSEIKAVEYYTGSGITNEMKCNIDKAVSPRRRWLTQRIANKKQNRVVQTAWEGLVTYYRANGAPPVYIEFAEEKLLASKIFNGNTISRLSLLPDIARYFFSHGRRKAGLLHDYARTTALELFGVKAASAIIAICRK